MVNNKRTANKQKPSRNNFIYTWCGLFYDFYFILLYSAISMLKFWLSLLEPTDIRMSHLKIVLQRGKKCYGKRMLSQNVKPAKNAHLITMLID